MVEAWTRTKTVFSIINDVIFLITSLQKFMMKNSIERIIFYASYPLDDLPGGKMGFEPMFHAWNAM